MNQPLRPFGDPAGSGGVYRAAQPRPIEDAARASGMDLVRISLRGAGSKEAALRAIAQALAFPDWFGGNWDALEDCLTDLSWRPAAGYVLLFEGQKSLARDDLGVLVDILRSAAEFWAPEGTPFFAVFLDPRDLLALPPLPSQP